MKTALRQVLITATFVAIVVGSRHPGHAQSPSRPPATAPVASLPADATADQQQAEELLKRAAKWRELADAARKNAAESFEPAFKQDWQQTATEHDKRADELEDEAKRLQQKAAAEAKQVGPPQNTAGGKSVSAASTSKPQTANRSDSDFPVAPVQQLYGRWIDERGEWADIEPVNRVDPDQKNQLQLVSKKHTWIGSYTPGSNPKPSRLTFTLRPKAEDMNADIPLWARKSVEGKVNWDLELNQLPVCGELKLEGKWYPGEVHWTDGPSQKAWVAGRGEPVSVRYEYDAEFDITSRHEPVLTVIVGNVRNSRFDRVRSLLKGQSFRLEVMVPEELAAKIGRELPVTVTNDKGQRDTIELSAPPGNLHQGVLRYTARDAFSINDYGAEPNRKSTLGPIPALSTVLSTEPGRRLSLAIDNGQTVFFRAAGAEQSVIVYDTWVQAGIARHEDALKRISGILWAVIHDRKSTAAQKEEAHQRLRLIDDAHAINARVSEYVGYFVGEAYAEGNPRTLPLVLRNDLHWFPRGAAADLRPNELNWAAQEEAEEVNNILLSRAKEYRTAAAAQLGLGFSFAAYQFVATATPVGDIWLLATGYDIFGKKADKEDKWTALWNVGLAPLQFGVNVSLDLQLATSSDRINRLGAVVQSQPIRVNVRTGTIKTVSPSDASGRIAASGNGTSPSLGGAAEPMTNSCPTQVAPSPQTGSASAHRPEILDLWYLGPTAQFKPGAHDYSHHMQQYNNSCAVASNNFLFEKATGERVREGDGVYALKEMGVFDVVRNMNASIASKGKFRPGLPDEVIRAYTEILGGTELYSKDLPLKTIYHLMEAGYQVRNRLIWRDTNGKALGAHAVAVDAIHLDANGEVATVDFFEPGPGRIVQMPACDYQRHLSTESDGGPNTTVIEFEKSPPQ